MPEVFVAKVSEFEDGDRRIVTENGREIGVFHSGGTYRAYSNYCLHAGGPVCEGLIINRVLEVVTSDGRYEGQTFGSDVHFVCPWHGYEYDLATGECVGDRSLKLESFDVVRRGDEIFVVV